MNFSGSLFKNPYFITALKGKSLKITIDLYCFGGGFINCLFSPWVNDPIRPSIHSLGGGFKYMLFFSYLFGEDSNFDYIFFNWVETTNKLRFEDVDVIFARFLFMVILDIKTYCVSPVIHHLSYTKTCPTQWWMDNQPTLPLRRTLSELRLH